MGAGSGESTALRHVLRMHRSVTHLITWSPSQYWQSMLCPLPQSAHDFGKEVSYCRAPMRRAAPSTHPEALGILYKSLISQSSESEVDHKSLAHI